MRQNAVLTIVSLLSVLFMTLHLADDIVRGMEPGTLFDLVVLPILAVQLYGTLVLAGKRSGYVIILVASLLELVVPVVHMKGRESAERSPGPMEPSSLSGPSSRSA